MDPTRGRPRTADDVALSRLTPSSSRRQISPNEELAIRPDQFPTLSNSPSVISASNFQGEGPSDLYRASFRNSSSNRLPSIRLRRNSNASIISTSTLQDGAGDEQPPSMTSLRHARPRSTSQPGNLPNSDRRTPQMGLPRLTEEGIRPTMEEIDAAAASGSRLSPTPSVPETDSRRAHSSMDIASTSSPPRRRRALSRIFWPATASEDERFGAIGSAQAQESEYEEQLVDLLDVVDPEVQTLSTLTNIQNSLFIPDLGPLINRRPTYTLTQHERPMTQSAAQASVEHIEPTEPVDDEESQPRIYRSNTITSRLTDSHYAALPHGVSLDGWTDEEKEQLDDHVRHMLHSRRSKFKRTMKGFGQYVRRPLGYFVTLYAVLITLFGLAWVLFLIGWIYVGSKQDYTIFVIDSVLVALFAIMGDGLAPFRAIDTYHMIFVVHYSRKMKKAREAAGMDTTDIGAIGSNPQESEAEARKRQGDGSEELIDYPELYPLTPKQQKKFLHHRDKLAKSHSFYKPEETFTHNSFPLSYLIAVIILLDCHSCLQISLGACTWGIPHEHRPVAITTTILCVSITTNITAGLVITAGDRKTRKKDVIKLLDRQELTSHAIKKVQKRKDEANNTQNLMV